MEPQKKKILYLITKSNFGGAQRYVYELATHMKDTHDVVVAFGGSGILKDKLEAAGIRTVAIKSFERDINIQKEIRSLFELWRLFRTQRPDVVHLNSSKAGGIGALIARLCGIKTIIYTAHGWAFWEPRPFHWRAAIWLASWITALLCHRVILVSEYENTRMRMPFVRHKCTVIHTAVPDIAFLPHDQARAALFSDEKIVGHANDAWLVSIAELTHNKNLTAGIDAVAEFNRSHRQQIFYTIIGEGELRETLSAYIREQSVDSYVELLGYVPDARVYLKGFDLFLLPSKKEGLPYAVLEAGLAELPVIASRVGGIPEVIEDQESGALIDPHDHTTIVEALETLIANPAIRDEFANGLRETIAQSFSLKEMLEKTSRLYAVT